MNGNCFYVWRCRSVFVNTNYKRINRKNTRNMLHSSDSILGMEKKYNILKKSMSNATHSFLTTRAQIRDLLKECLTIMKNQTYQLLILAIYYDIIWNLDLKKKKKLNPDEILWKEMFSYTLKYAVKKSGKRNNNPYNSIINHVIIKR